MLKIRRSNRVRRYAGISSTYRDTHKVRADYRPEVELYQLESPPPKLSSRTRLM